MEIKTYLRVRPVSTPNKELYEIAADKKSIIIKESALSGAGLGKKKQMQMDGPPTDSEFKFDSVFNMDCSQNDIYKQTVLPLLEQATNKSLSTAIVAQGENLSGKSFTIFGVENIQQEEFSIDNEDPKDTRGVALKAIHYLFKKSKSEGKVVTLDCQMLDIYLDTIRDLSKGKTNKFNKPTSGAAGNLVFEREKDVEIEELPNGEIKLNNVQNCRINNAKEAASFIEKCLDYQKKLENDNQQYRSFAHTIFIINLTYGKEITSQIYFADLGSSERKGAKKQKEGFVVQSSLARISESGMESCLKTLESSDRIKNNQADKKNNGNGNINQQNPDGSDNQEFNIDQLIQHLNKENFDLRNQIETLKRSIYTLLFQLLNFYELRQLLNMVLLVCINFISLRSHKIKLEELQQLLQIPCEIEYILKNKDNAPEMQMIHEQRKAMEKADSLIKMNKDLEKHLIYFQFTTIAIINIIIFMNKTP